MLGLRSIRDALVERLFSPLSQNTKAISEEPQHELERRDTSENIFIYPPPAGGSKEYSTNLVFEVNQTITLNWNTSFFVFDLVYWQDLPCDPSCSNEDDMRVGISNTTLEWVVDPSPFNLSDSNVFWFGIYNFENTTEQFHSHYFNITEPAKTTSTTSSISSTSTASSTSASSASSTSLPSTPKNSSSEHSGLSVGAIVGISIGVVLGALAAAAVIVFFWRRRKGSRAVDASEDKQVVSYSPMAQPQELDPKEVAYPPQELEQPPQELSGAHIAAYHYNTPELP